MCWTPFNPSNPKRPQADVKYLPNAPIFFFDRLFTLIGTALVQAIGKSRTKTR